MTVRIVTGLFEVSCVDSAYVLSLDSVCGWADNACCGVEPEVSAVDSGWCSHVIVAECSKLAEVMSAVHVGTVLKSILVSTGPVWVNHDDSKV